MQIWLDSSSLVTKGLPMSVPEYGALLSDHGQSEPYTPFADPHDPEGAEVRS